MASALATATAATSASMAVRLNQVARTYRAGTIEVPALKNVSLEIPFHRFSMVIGQSGSGKTTLLNLIGCIDAPSGGTVEVCGQNVAELNDDATSDFRQFPLQDCTLLLRRQRWDLRMRAGGHHQYSATSS
jgi:ABC-type lipoprotein export system ATPase subunit